MRVYLARAIMFKLNHHRGDRLLYAFAQSTNPGEACSHYPKGEYTITEIHFIFLFLSGSACMGPNFAGYHQQGS